MIGLGLSITQLAVRQMLGFNPLSLFAANEPGVWYDPSDLTTLFQDAAGTTPVTAVEQPVGRMLDKSGNGAHASQATATSRPVLSARYNQLLNTVAMTGGYWIATNIITTANQITAPDGTLTGELVTSTSTSTYHLRAYGFFLPVSLNNTFTVSLSKGTQRYLAVIVGDADGNRYGCNVDTDNWSIVSTGTAASGVFTSATIKQNVSNSWYEITITGSTIGTAVAVYVAARDSSAWNGDTLASVTGGGTWYNCGFDYRATNTGVGLPAYQRVNTATDYDTIGFPRYLKFDNIDDAHNTTFAASLGTNCTIARAVPGVGASILTGQTVGTTFTNTTTHAGLLVIDRPLTAGETAQLTAFFNEKAGV